MNRKLLKIIKAKLDDVKGAWPEELPNVLWTYRTTTRTPTGETPFKLTYGIEVVIPVEVGVASIRREVLHEEHNEISCESTWIAWTKSETKPPVE